MKIFRMNASHAGGSALTGAAAIDLSFDFSMPYLLREVRLKLSAVTTDLDDFVISLDSETGAAYDSIIAMPDATEDLTVVTTFRYADPVPMIIFPGDRVKVEWPNTGTKTWAVDVIGERL